MYRLIGVIGSMIGSLLLLAAGTMMLAVSPPATAPGRDPPKAASAPRVLVFSKTAAFRHDSIEAGIASIKTLGHDHGFTVEAGEDAGAFTDDNLRRYRVVIFLNTTGDVLNDDQQQAFERFVRAGGGFVGVHAAADAEYDWPWYTKLVGAQFASHPRIQSATINVVDREHDSTRHLPDKWTRSDEWYNFREHPSKVAGGQLRIMATLDESSYEGGTMNGEHPIAWCQEFDGGRAWYTGLGHTIESYREEAFLQHLLGGIRWAMGDNDRSKE